MSGSGKPFSYDEPMPPSEFMRLADDNPSGEAIEEMVALIRWFRRRYPTVEARFEYATRKTHALRNAPRAKVR